MIDGCKLFAKTEDGFVDTNPEYYGMFPCRKCREKFL